MSVWFVIKLGAVFAVLALCSWASPASAEPSNVALSQSADKTTVTATWTKTPTDLTSVQWDVTSDRPGFGHKFVNESTNRTVSWQTDRTNCGTGWRYTVTGYDANGTQVGSSRSVLFAPACPVALDAPARVEVVNASPLPVRFATPQPVTVPTPVHVEGTVGVTAASPVAVSVKDMPPQEATIQCGEPGAQCSFLATLDEQQYLVGGLGLGLLVFFAAVAFVKREAVPILRG